MFEDFKKGLAKIGLADAVEVEDKPSVPPVAAPTLTNANPYVVPAQWPTTVPAPTPVPPPGYDPERIAKYDASAQTALQEVFQSVNVRLIPELQTLLTTLEAAIPAEPMRYQTALKIFTAKGTPITAILSEYDLYIGALEEKNRVFSNEIKGQFDTRVGSKIKAVQDYDAQIVATQAQIETLKQQIADLTVKRSTEQGGIAEAQGKLELMQQRFTLQYNAMRSKVDQQKTQVAEYGKGL